MPPPSRTAVSGSITGINLAAGASLWVRWVDTNASGAGDGLAIDDISFEVAGDPPADRRPCFRRRRRTMPSTMPLASTLSVSFQRSGDANRATWYSIGAPVSGSHTASQAGGPDHLH
ncbi:MAG: hypothetical protein R3F08_16480 [Dokdonella sp.]